MMRLAGFALLLLAPVAPLCATPQASPAAAAEWTWTGPNADHRPVKVRIVRGSYRIVRRDGPVFVAMRVRGGSGPVGFTVDDKDRVTISDAYPSNPLPSWNECLPPVDGRGDFWASDAVIDAVIEAPPSVPVEVDVMDPRPLPTGHQPPPFLDHLGALLHHEGEENASSASPLNVPA